MHSMNLPRHTLFEGLVKTSKYGPQRENDEKDAALQSELEQTRALCEAHR
jgi:hypothetical protein